MRGKRTTVFSSLFDSVVPKRVFRCRRSRLHTCTSRTSMIVVRKSKVPFRRGRNANEANRLRRAVAPNNSYLFLELLEELAGHDGATDSNHANNESERGIKNTSSGCMKHKIQGANLTRPILSIICANDVSALWLFLRQRVLERILELPPPRGRPHSQWLQECVEGRTALWLEAAKVRDRHGSGRRLSPARCGFNCPSSPRLQGTALQEEPILGPWLWVHT